MFNSPLSGTTQVSWYQKGKTNVDFTGARDSEWQWHQLGHMHDCTSLQTDNQASTPPLKFFTGRVPFVPPNQQCQSTEGITYDIYIQHDINKRIMYIVPKSKIESRAHYTREPARGKRAGTERNSDSRTGERQ